MMMFTGYGGCGGPHSIDTTMSYIKSIKEFLLQDGIFDEFYVTQRTDFKAGDSVPKIWDFDTIIHALFNGNLLGGNVEYTVDEVSKLRIKCREAGTYHWVTLYEIPLSKNADMRFERLDYYRKAGKTYEYAIVPVLADDYEGNYTTNTVLSDFDGIWLIDRDSAIHAELNVDLSTNRNTKSNVIETSGSKYPYIYHYGDLNYVSGTVKAFFLEYNESMGDYDIDNAVDYRYIVESFLTNKKPKVIKHFDGRIFLAAVTGIDGIDESQHYKMPIHSFTFNEIGSTTSETDMYNAGLSDVIVSG